MHDPDARAEADADDCRGAPERLGTYLPRAVLLGLDADPPRPADDGDSGFDAADDLPW